MNTEITEASDYAGCYAPELPSTLRFAEAGLSDKEQAALEVLKSTGIDVLEAALVAREALECGRGRVRRALPVFASTCWMHVACFAEVSG